MMISNWKPFGLHGSYKNISALQGLRCLVACSYMDAYLLRIRESTIYSDILEQDIAAKTPFLVLVKMEIGAERP